MADTQSGGEAACRPLPQQRRHRGSALGSSIFGRASLPDLADEVSIAREELRRRLRSGLMSAAQHGEAMARLEQWNAARRSTVQDDAYVATTAQTGISLLMRGCCVQEARNAAVQRLAHPSDRQRPR